MLSLLYSLHLISPAANLNNLFTFFSLLLFFLLNSVDHTRVMLKEVDNSVAGADYINANHIHVSKLKCKTQQLRSIRNLK